MSRSRLDLLHPRASETEKHNDTTIEAYEILVRQTPDLGSSFFFETVVILSTIR